MLKTVQVSLGERSYAVVIGSGARNYLLSSKTLTESATAVAVVTERRVSGLWLHVLTATLPKNPLVIAVAAGEGSKRLATVETVCDQLADARIDRAGLVVAFGGGMVGDLAGFVAAIWGRGIRFVQVPTTLLASIDASVGGKTGVNLAGGKNLIGAFHQPVCVVIDTDFLATLPKREFTAGLAESVKHAAIRNPDLLDWHASNRPAILAREPDTITELIARNCQIKSDVVSRDERESGLRAILNHGHTVGHALESLLEYELLHGECVALGMIVENRIAVARGLLASATADRIQALLSQLELPTRLSRPADCDAVWRYCLADKKNQAGAVHAVLLRDIGNPIRVGDITQAEVTAALAAIQPGQDA